MGIFNATMASIAAGAPETQVLEIIVDDDPFEVESTRNDTTDMYPDRVVSRIVYDVSHALFPEQSKMIVDAVLL